MQAIIRYTAQPGGESVYFQSEFVGEVVFSQSAGSLLYQQTYTGALVQKGLHRVYLLGGSEGIFSFDGVEIKGTAPKTSIPKVVGATFALGVLEMAEQSLQPSTPTAENSKLYFDAAGKLQKLASDGVPVEIVTTPVDLPTATSDFLAGVQVAGVWSWVKKTLAEVKSILGLGSAAYTASSDYAVAAKGVTNGDSHDHSGGDGAQIDYNSLANLPAGTSLAGFLSVAFQIGFVTDAAFASTITLPANGGSIAIPILVDAPMLFNDVYIRQVATATARTWGWDLYYQVLSTDNVLTRVAASNGNDTFTPTVASFRTLAASGAPVTLAPGLYWLVIQNRHASSTFLLAGSAQGSNFATAIQQTKTTSNPNGGTLDFTAATWTKASLMVAARLEGRVFGQSTVF